MPARCWQQHHLSPNPRTAMAYQGLALFAVRRVDIECDAREMEALGRARSTVARRLCTFAGFYKYSEQDGLIERSPAVHVRRPRLDYESHAAALDRNELGALLVRRGPRRARRARAGVVAGVERLADLRGPRRQHRRPGSRAWPSDITVMRKGGKMITMPLAPRVARTIDLTIGERLDGPISSPPPGNAWTATPQPASSGASLELQGSTSTSHPTPCAMCSSPPPSTPASPSATYRKPPATQIHAPRCATTAADSPSIATPHTSSPPSSPAPAAEPQPLPTATSSGLR
jgi:hypothetical protein